MQAAPFLRAARGELVSVRQELKTLLYAGVLVAIAGAGLFVKEFHDRLGPVLIASVLGAAAVACFVYVFRRAPGFTWGRTVSPHLAVDYVLLLGVLLIGSNLAYVERQFKILGADWPLHLLVLSVVYFVAAYRFDSRAVLSLAVAALAAWRGITLALPFASARNGEALEVLRLNAIVLGVLYIAAGAVSVRTNRKAHFEDVWVTMGLLLLFGGVLTGVYGDQGWLLWFGALAVLAAPILIFAYRRRRRIDFGIALFAAYLGVARLPGEVLGGELNYLAVAAVSLAALAILIAATRRMSQPR